MWRGRKNGEVALEDVLYYEPINQLIKLIKGKKYKSSYYTDDNYFC